MSKYCIGVNENDQPYLAHFGIKGQKWGVRNYQNPDGTLTEAGKRRYARSYQKELNRLEQDQAMRSARSASLSWYKNSLDKKIERRDFKGKNADELKEKRDIAQKKISDLNDGYKENKKKLDALLEEIDADNNYVWRSYLTQYVNYDASKGLKDISSLFKNQNAYYDSAYGTGYKVKTATDKRKQSVKWNINKDHYSNVPVHTEYYYI